MYKNKNEKIYNLRIQLKEIKDIFPIKGTIIVSTREWKDNYSYRRNFKIENVYLNNIYDFLKFFNEYKKLKDIIIINIKILLINDERLENL
jgi:hypothetical protein